jgi:hypothetical protein
MISTTATPRKVKGRLAPLKLLTLLMYAPQVYCETWNDGRLTMKLGPIARAMRCSTGRVREHLEWLAVRAYIYDLELTHGACSFAIRYPGVFSLESPQRNSI